MKPQVDDGLGVDLSTETPLLGAAGWQRLRVRFALLYLAAAIAAVVWLDFLSPLPPAGAPLRVPLLSAYLLGGAALAWRPRWLPTLALAVLPLSALDIFWFAFQAPSPLFPPVLNLLFFVAIAATVFAGPRAGDAFVALLLAGLDLLAWRHPWLRTDFLALKQLSNLALMLAVLHLLLRAYWRRVQQAVLQLGLATQALLEHSGQIHALGQVAFQDVRGRMWTLGRVLDQAVPGRAELQKAVTELQALLQAKRMELGELAEGPELNTSRDSLLGLRTRMQGLVLAALGAAFALALLRNTLQSGFPPGATAAGALFLAGAALLHRRSSRWGPWAFRAALFANQWQIFGYDWAHRADQPLLFAANHSVSVFLVFLGALLDTPWAGGALLAGDLLAVAVFARAGVGVGGGMTGVLLGLSLAAAGALWALPLGVLTRLESQRRELILARWHRQRLQRSLFHDLANPLQVLFLEFEAQAGADRLRATYRRMHRVMNTAASLENAPIELRNVPLRPILDELNDLHREPLRAKALSLTIRCESVSVLAEPGLLLESVLGNLLGNAIKFTPSGGRIMLTVERSAGWVELRLLDQGPGMPASALDAQQTGRRMRSTPGSQGELGSGFGLGLARDYVAQMNGELTFWPGQPGGTEALVRLKAL